MNATVDVSELHIETERLLLRAVSMDDLNDFNHYASVEGVGDWAGWKAHKSLEESRQILAIMVREKKTIAIVSKEDGHMIGTMGLENYHWDLDPYSSPTLLGREIGYVLSKDYWGQGIMSEAVKAVIAYAFNICHLDFLTVAHFVNNERSKRVILKAGFRPLGQFAGRTNFGEPRQEIRYVLDNPKRHQ